MPPVTPSSTRVATLPQAREPSPAQSPDTSGLPSFLQTLSQRMDAPPPVAAASTNSAQVKDGASAKPIGRNGSADGPSADDASKSDAPSAGDTATAAKTESTPSSTVKAGKDAKDAKDAASASSATNTTRAADDPALAALIGRHAAAAPDRAPSSTGTSTDGTDAGIAAAAGTGTTGGAATDRLGLTTGTRPEALSFSLDATTGKGTAGSGQDRVLTTPAGGEPALVDPFEALKAAFGSDSTASPIGSGDGRAFTPPAGDAAPPPSVAALAPTVEATAATGAAAAAFKVEPRVGSAAFSEALGNRVVWIAKSDTQSAELHLNPPDLGPLQVVVDVNRDQATAFFSSPHADVRQAIEDALPRLREMFAQSGIQLGNASVGSDPRSHQDQADGNSGRARADRLNAPTGTVGGATAASRPLRIGTGLVDTFA